MIKKLYILLWLILLPSCRNASLPGSLLDRARLVVVYADLLIVREENNISRLDSSQARIRIDSLCRTYQTSSARVESSIQFYKSDINQWREFYDEVAARIETIQQKQRRNSTN